MLLPLAGVEMHPIVPPLVGLGVGVVSGLFGVGGGFIMTPALVWAGVPPEVAVGTGLSQMVAASSSGALLNARLGNVSLRLGALVASGGIAAGFGGACLVRALLREGAFGGALGAAYVVVLLAIGAAMILESRRARRARGDAGGRAFGGSPAADAAAFAFGALAGFVSAVLGLGGGVLLVPTMIYVLRVPTRTAVGTSLFVALCVSFGATVSHSAMNANVDVVLAALLVAGSVPGACLGVWLGRRVDARALRGLFGGVLVLAAARMAWDLAGGRLGPGARGAAPVAGGTLEGLRAFALEHGVLYGIAAATLALVVGGGTGLLLRGRVCASRAAPACGEPPPGEPRSDDPKAP